VSIPTARLDAGLEARVLAALLEIAA